MSAWRAKARVKRLGIQDIVVVGPMLRLIHASQLITQNSSRIHARAHTAMRMMMEPAPSLVLLQIMSSHSVLLLQLGTFIYPWVKF